MNLRYLQHILTKIIKNKPFESTTYGDVQE